MIRDKGTESGTFIKVTAPRVLRLGTLLEMGSFLIEVASISYQTSTITLSILHMMEGENKHEAIISLTDNCNFFSFGRRKNNSFWADDEHLSSIHAKIFLQRG